MFVLTKNRILDVSIDLFSEFGYDGVSIRQIAGEVGIRESSIYNHYSNKESILKAILDYYIEEMVSDEIPIDQASLNLDKGFDYFYDAGCNAFLSKLHEEKMMKITRLFFIESYHNDDVRNFLKESIVEGPIYGWMNLFNLMKDKNIIQKDCDVKQLSESFFYYGMFLLYEHFVINYPEDDEKFLKEFLEKTRNHAKIIFNSVKTEDDYIIRLESENDYLEVEKLNRNAFWNIYRPGAYEHYIVHKLRDDKSFIKNLAYVIEKDEEIVGNINYSLGKISYENQIEDAVVLGPIAIAKNYQKHGLGSKLINYTLTLTKKDYPYVFVIGDENYYSRFGFESASKYNIYLDGTPLDEENPFFMIKVFDKSVISQDLVIFHNPEVFNVSENEVDEFDKQFEYKEKLVLEGQLGD